MMISNLKRPNFFIVGAPKSGTTALSEYLRGHPSVFMASPKEPHYFATDMDQYRSISEPDDYFELFARANPQHLAIGEASVWYLYSTEAIGNIRNYNKNSKIIVMLRKPVDMIYAMHSQHLVSMGEDEPDFEKAWKLEAQRRAGKKLPKGILHRENLYYSQIAAYGSQLENLYENFPRDQVFVVLYDDFLTNTRAVFQNIEQFLNVPASGRVNFPSVNRNKRLRLPILKKLLRLEAKATRRFRKKLPGWMDLDGPRIEAWMKRVMTTELLRAPMSDEMKSTVQISYFKEVELLSELIDRDLSHWSTE